MPNKRAEGTKLRAIGVDQDLWDAAQAAATKEVSVAAVMREGLKAWLGRPDARYDLFTPPTDLQLQPGQH